MRVVFLAPDLGSAEGFYDVFADIMRVAASQLDISLEVLGCGRDRQRMIDQALALTGRVSRPDYVLLVNYVNVAPEILPAFDGTDMRAFFVVEGITGGEATPLGNPSRKHSSWVGEVVPDDVNAGYLLAKTLTDTARAQRKTAADGKIHIGCLAGEHTPAGNARFRGFLNLRDATPDILQANLQYGEWHEEVARRVTGFMIKGDPEIAVIWAANDAMALGALGALREAGKTPGRDVLVGGVDLDASALEAVADGSLAVSVGGHILDGARALVLLHAHHTAKNLPPTSHRTHLVAVTAEDAKRYLRFMKDRAWRQVDFTQFSGADSSGSEVGQLSLARLVLGEG